MAGIVESLFGVNLNPDLLQQQIRNEQEQRAFKLAQMGNSGPFAGASYGALVSGERLRESAMGAMGQEDPRVSQQRKLASVLAATQQQADLATPDGLIQLAENLNQFPEFSNIAILTRQEAAKLAQQQKQQGLEQRLTEAKIGTEGFRQTKLAAEAEAKLREPTAKKGTLAERLVELETKKAQQPLTASEAAELVALEKVVKIQSPKGTDLTGLAAVFGKKASEEEAKETGKQLATIEGKQQAVESLNSALGILKQGVYTGSYAEYQTTLAKKSLGVVGDIKRVENTEVFLNEVSSNVIPLLQEFGGNDSNEELKFLQRLVGGDITLEQRSIERILNNAIKKINRGIERTAAKGQAIRQGKLPPLPQAAKPQAQTRTTKSGIAYTVEEE